jgi:flavin-dependent dehydrogenase
VHFVPSGPFDVAVVGGGPAGLAVAIEAARRGLSTVLFEKHPELPDKACGEGVMPAGVAALESLGVLGRLAPGDFARLEGVRYVEEDGRAVEAPLPGKGGLGIRRTALVSAMGDVARAQGVDLRLGCAVTDHRRAQDAMELVTPGGLVRARMLLAADGLGSRLRRLEGLDAPGSLRRRFGLRRHFRRAPWTSCIEVHFARSAEAYVTPVGPDRVGIAFLWEDGRPRCTAHPDGGGRRRAEESVSAVDEAPLAQARWQRLAASFPRLLDRLDDAEPDSKLRGAGPLARSAVSRIGDRFALVGDAAGYVDAITGEGISLSLASAAMLGAILPEAIARGATRGSLLRYEREFARSYRRYAWPATGVLAVARRPWLRRSVLALLGTSPSLFRLIVATVLGVAS